MWCPTCEESVTGHDAMCTTCGDTLTNEMPSSSRSNGGTTSNSSSSAIRTSQIREQQNQLDRMAQQLFQMVQAQQAGTGRNNDENVVMTNAQQLNDELWEEAPIEAMNPQAATERSRPTSKECLDRIPRITIDERSSILHEATVDIWMSRSNSSISEEDHTKNSTSPGLSFNAMIGELGAIPPYQISISEGIVVAEPIYGGSSIDDSEINKQSLRYKDRVVLVQRGGGLTFRQKAEWAQAVGAKALLVGNNVSVWPYVMKDSSRKSINDDNLHIPVLMLKRSDGKELQQMMVSQSDTTITKCIIDVVHIKELSSSGTERPKKKESYECACVVCRDGFEKGNVVMRLPFCSHVFHEACALSWLTKHNTCPVCRRELPTDDIEYETERRRVARTHGGASSSDTADNPNNGWETMLFG